MSRIRWNSKAKFTELVLEPDFDDRQCRHCGQFTHIYEHGDRRLHTMKGGLHLVSKMAHCPAKDCPGHGEVVESVAAMGLAPPYWAIGWDVFAWMGHRRFARDWSVPQIRAELKDSYGIEVSSDLIEDYLKRYQVMVAARESAPEQLADAYRNVKDLVLTIDGLQPEKGHETLYVVRELNAKRVWFAIPLLSSSAAEVKRVLELAAEWAKKLGKPVRLWVSDKQKAFVTGIAAVFPQVPHRYCANHFLRDLAKPVLELDSHAKVQMRRKVRGLRKVEGRILAELGAASTVAATAAAELDVAAQGVNTSTTMVALASIPRDESTSNHVVAQGIVLEYAAAIRGILNDDQGGPLDPPGLRMAEALQEVQGSLQRCVARKRGALARAI